MSYKLPSMTQNREQVEAGCAVSYGVKLSEMHGLAAADTDKMLRGARPEDTPAQQPANYELIIIASGKSRKGGRDVVTRKPFIVVQRVRLPPGKGEPASRKRALRGWWQHHSRSVGSRRLSPAVAPI